MKKSKLTKVITSTLIVASVLALNPIGVSAEWRQDNSGWWYAESNSYAKNCWRIIDGNCYHFDKNGYMEHDTQFDHYVLGSNGAWVVSDQAPPVAGYRTISTATTTSNTSSTVTTNTASNNTTGIYSWSDDITYMNFQKNCIAYFEYAGPNSKKTVKDNLGNKYSNFLTLETDYESVDNNCYIEFPLNGEYKQFKSLLGLTEQYKNDLISGTVKIYLDDQEVYNETLSNGDMLRNINLNLAGKNKIKFYFGDCEGTDGHTWTRVEIGFFNGQFIK